MLAVMVQNLFMASVMVAVTVSVHFFGLMALLHFLRRRGSRFRTHESVVGQGALVLVMVFGVFAIHTVEIWLYAAAYTMLHAAQDFETALYFSTVTFASLGYGDIVLSRDWRLFGAIEAANGVILFAWSTAFLLSVMARLRALEHDWSQH
ncbi:MAG TPA: potassium channel family protein [Caulobacterales bacterium]|nr:potassium channel family protein [Caulobacterales bacterium]